ncbi:MAG: DMT family transporter [Devosiaceae bacterium]
MIRKATPTDLALLLLLAAAYGSAFTGIKIAVPQIGPFGLVLVRILIGVAVLLPYAFMRGWTWPTKRSSWQLIGVLCVFNLILPFFLVSWSQLHLNASLMALIMGAGPFFGLLVSHMATQDDRLSVPKLAGVVIGFVGITIVLGIDALIGLSGGGLEVRLAQGAALLASFCYACSGVLVRKIDDVPSHQLASLVLGIGAVAMLTATPFLAPDILERAASVDRSGWLAIVYLGAITTGGAYILRYTLIRAVGMSFFGLSIYLVPVFGVGIAALWLAEPLHPSLLIGLVLILIGMGVARLKFRLPKRY